MNSLTIIYKIKEKVRTKFFSFVFGVRFSRVGFKAKLFGFEMSSSIIGNKVSIGDYCWLEVIHKYHNQKLNPQLNIGKEVSFSDFVHVSCANLIYIGDGCLIGSKVYIGDHAHGYGPNAENIPPANRRLIHFGKVNIGERCWIGDNVVLLGDTVVASDSVIAANSVVKNLIVERPAIIAGNPAKVVKYLDMNCE